MKFNLVADSCVDYNDQVFKEGELTRVPFKVMIDDVEFIDKEKRVENKLDAVNFRAKTISTACPAPSDFMEAVKEATDSFIVTISSKLSGAYQSAKTAVDMILDEYEEAKHIHVFDSKSASAGESLVALKVSELIKEELPFDHIVEKTQEYIDSLKTIFALESLDTLVSNGRVSIGKRFLVKALGVYPIMGADKDGRIEQKGFTRGKHTVISKLIETIGEDKEEYKNRILAITHVNIPRRAEELKEALIKSHSFKDIIIFEAGGLSSVYASDGGLVLAY